MEDGLLCPYDGCRYPDLKYTDGGLRQHIIQKHFPKNTPHYECPGCKNPFPALDSAYRHVQKCLDTDAISLNAIKVRQVNPVTMENLKELEGNIQVAIKNHTIMTLRNVFDQLLEKELVPREDLRRFVLQGFPIVRELTKIQALSSPCSSPETKRRKSTKHTNVETNLAEPTEGAEKEEKEGEVVSVAFRNIIRFKNSQSTEIFVPPAPQQPPKSLSRFSFVTPLLPPPLIVEPKATYVNCGPLPLKPLHLAIPKKRPREMRMITGNRGRYPYRPPSSSLYSAEDIQKWQED